MTSPNDTSGSLEWLPCGCRMGTVGDAFVMEPCSPDCQYWLYALAESKRQGKPLMAIVDPEVSDEVSDEALKAYGMKP